MEAPVEIKYAGVVVARASEVRHMTVGGVDMFLAMPEPLPAGTVVQLNGDTQARIEKVIESADPSVAGVYVRLLGDGEPGQPWVPSFRESEVPAPRPPAVVVSPVIVRPVHIPRTPVAEAPRPEPPRPEPVATRPETPLPEVVAMPAPPPPAESSRPFVSPMPRPDEQIAHFDSPPPTPPEAAVESAIQRDRERSKRHTIVVAVPPPAEITRSEEAPPPGAVKRAAGEIDTGSRRIKSQGPMQPSQSSIVVEPEPHPEAEAAPSPADGSDESKQTELKLEDLSTAKALPSARGRGGRKRRNTTSR